MQNIFNDLVKDFIFSGDLVKDSNNFLLKHNRIRIAEHSLRVAEKSKSLARIYGVDENLAEVAGLLHDIGGVYPNNKRVDIANMLKLNVLPEEEEFPLILHQKISEVMAKEIFNIQATEILSAIGCHTTLKTRSTILDKILFVADKIQWDQDGAPPYIYEIEKAVNVSLDLAAFVYIKYLFEDKSKLKVVHPWMEEVYDELRKK